MSDRDKEARHRQQAKAAKAAEEDRLMEATLRGPLGNSATHVEWRIQMHAIKGWSRPTFKRRLNGFKQRHPELTGARWRGDPYSLPTQPTAAMADLVASLRTWLSPRARQFSAQEVRLAEPEPGGAQTGSVGLRDLDLIAKARAHVKSAKME
jgi:hypothetical protein